MTNDEKIDKLSKIAQMKSHVGNDVPISERRNKEHMKKVMFLCTANSCRSQMAEGFARELGKGILQAYSAGSLAAGVQPRAITVMREAGIDIAGQESKDIDTALLGTMDIVVTLCTNAEASCPLTPASIRRLHWPIHDPVGTVGSEEEIMSEFRKTRDEIKVKIEELLEEIKEER